MDNGVALNPSQAMAVPVTFSGRVKAMPGRAKASVAIGLVALTATGRVPAATAALGWTVAGLGMGLGLTSLSVLVLELSEPREQGANAASLQVSDGLGSILLIGAAGAIFAAYAGSATDPTGAADVGATPYPVVDLGLGGGCLAGPLPAAAGSAV